MGSAALLLIVGCASQGPLRPPSLKLPGSVHGLSATRTGDAVDIRWTTPTRTTDGILLAGRHGAGSLAVEICREAGSGAGPCSPIRRIPTLPGAAERLEDPLPEVLRQGAPVILYYRVRVVNGLGKGAAYSQVETLAGSAPDMVTGLHASRAANGVDLRWNADPAAAGDRTVLRVRRGDGRTAGPEEKASEGTLLAVEPGVSDPGGTSDAAAAPGVPQNYSVYRTRTVHLGGRDITMSGPSAVAIVAADASLPAPPAPTGLDAVANSLGTPQIDLVWQPSAGAAGYRVYRAEGDGEPVLLTPASLMGLTFADAAIRPGIRYRYSVVAVGPSGAVSSRSGEAVETGPQP